MNSGSGINEGVYKINFEDGTEICFMTPPNEMSGLSYGDRKFNLAGKCNSMCNVAYYWSEKEGVVL